VLSKRKKVGWSLLSLGLGGTLLFVVVLLALWKLPSRNMLWLWPVATLTLAVLSALHLRRCYREDPLACPHSMYQ
jgi:hypothetical protein